MYNTKICWVQHERIRELCLALLQEQLVVVCSLKTSANHIGRRFELYFYNSKFLF